MSGVRRARPGHASCTVQCRGTRKLGEAHAVARCGSIRRDTVKWLARGLSPVVAPLSDPESAKKKRLPPDFTSHHACWVNYLQNSLPGVTQ